MVSSADELTIKRQCELLGVNRTTLYYKPMQSAEEAVMREEYIKSRIDFWHTKDCTWGHRKLCRLLRREDKIDIGRKLVLKYMKEMNIYTVYPKPNLSKADKKAHKMPYLLKNLRIDHPNHVWAVDITYIKMGRSHMYLTAVIDWNTRFIVGYELSDTLDTAPVLEAVKRAIDKYGKPEIINSDQGSQFTSDEYVDFLKEENIRQSMDGKARWVDNVIIERWFRSLKVELIYINDYNSPRELRQAVGSYVYKYNTERPHESLDYQYPADLYLTA